MSQDIYKRAIEKYGRENQIGMLLEEMAELTVSICHFAREKCAINKVSEEITDVEIMLEQMKIVFENPNYDYDHEKESKLLKLEKRLGGEG